MIGIIQHNRKKILMSTVNHPVWDVYNLMRTARLNIKYLQYYIALNKKQNIAIEIILALSTTSLATIFWFVSSNGLELLIKIVSSVAASVAVIKPILDLSSKIKLNEELLTAYRVLEHDLEKISIGVRLEQKYSQSLQQKFNDAMDRKIELIKMNNGSEKPSRILLKKIAQEVDEEYPLDSFYIPQ